MKLILASKSEARGRLLHAAGYAFTQLDSGVVEPPPLPGAKVTDYVTSLAREKALAVSRRHPKAVVIGADTALAIDDQIIGKADDAQHAIEMLLALSGKTHLLATGVCAVVPGAGSRGRRVRAGVDTARVTIRAWPESRIRRYVETVCPFGCAGAYALQADGSAIVERIEGDPSTIVGLPMGLVASLLKG